MAGKRHHYLSQFLLRRFADKARDRPGLVWRHELSGERLLQVAPKREAAKRHYYRLGPDIQLPSGFAEDLLARIETGAGASIAKLDHEQKLDLDDRHWLAMFMCLQHRRTPAGRRELRFIDEQIAKLQMELQVGDREAVRRVLSVDGREVSDEELAVWQQKTLEELGRGDIIIESTSDREILLMFNQLDRLAPTLVEKFDWKLLRVPPSIGEFVLPDVGLSRFDSTPPFPKAGTGFASSPNTETAIHLGPRLALVLRPGTGCGYEREASRKDVERLNLRAYACSDRCLYGASEELVQTIVALGKADPDRIERLRPRPATLWITESEDEPQAGVVEFTGYSLAGVETQELVLSQEGIDEARSRIITSSS
jgi:hypothetical protein